MREGRREDMATQHDSLLALARGHLRFGWTMLLIFLTLGFVLETFHGLKVAYYLDTTNETRRLMWTLAHAHGTLLSLIQIVFGLTVRGLADWSVVRRTLASRCLYAATILIPAGFFLGGIIVLAGDPSPLVLLVPLGAVLLFTGVLLTAGAVRRFAFTVEAEGVASGRKRRGG